ncbi:hypothetical protein BDB00DRAFT_800847 [Zychaea mexicana]|uniref:uncharacterized protein n=1 Tax=Zychaea mexicana TaxID=64656 RepID=UPI0022FE9065|nr:uncharacterized protein BDB00DRAFT_800847 [Zychaea mexicana]KAI9498049.1 hypothetical protein BDB00DRAFT_800847 [Zychaea mexicana]
MGKPNAQQDHSASKTRTTTKTTTKRKISCLPCRLKKVKCDGNRPCQRCQAKDTNCLYAKPAPVGRPPKNAVVNKLVLARNEEPIPSLSSSLCKEFIFEHVSYTKTPNDTSYLFSGKEIGLQYYIKDIFSAFFGPDNSACNEIVEGQKMTKAGELAKLVSNVKMYDMLQYFTWMTSDLINIMIRRFSRLSLDNYIEPDFTLYSLQIDHSKDFFGDAADNAVNPLNSLPPQQAMRFIECFFCIHPYSLMFNKTMIMQSYWTDSADPLLMTVIYGTTAYISQLLEGKPVALWETVTTETHRNAFLNYAYVLINKSSAEASLSRYQALILLALFEVTFGYAKRGMSLFALGHMIATRVGLFLKTRQRMSDVEEESCLMTFWSAYNCTMRGCIEMDQVPREVLNKFTRPFPPARVEESASYRFDQENNNVRMFKSYHYLIESFYCQSVISQFSSRLFMYFPESKQNIFRRRPSFISTTLSDSTALSLAQVDIEEALNSVLNQFSVFIETNRHRWSTQQQYTIESTYILYKIHFSFLKLYVLTAKLDGIYESRPLSGNRRHGRIPVPVATTNIDMEMPIDLDDIEVVIRMHLVVPMAVDLLEKTRIYLASPANYNNQPAWLPHGLVASALETSAKILMLKYRRDPWDLQTWHHLEAVRTITSNHRWAIWTSMLLIEKKLSEFFEQYPAPPSGNNDNDNDNSNTDTTVSSLFLRSTASPVPSVELFDTSNNASSLESSVSPVPYFFDEPSNSSNNNPVTAFEASSSLSTDVAGIPTELLLDEAMAPLEASIDSSITLPVELFAGMGLFGTTDVVMATDTTASTTCLTTNNSAECSIRDQQQQHVDFAIDSVLGEYRN